MLINKSDNGDSCLTANIQNETLRMMPCEEDNYYQKWEFDFVNLTAFADWKNTFGYKEIVWPEKFGRN